MHLFIFLVSICCLFLILFSVHLFFAKKGNKLLNILLSILLFARFGQIFNSLLITIGQIDLFSFIYQIFTPLYFAAPTCFYLYFTCFIHNRRKLRKFDWLHFIPAIIAIIHVLPWHFQVPLNWDLIAKQLAENGYISLRTKTGLLTPFFIYAIKPLLALIYLIFAWISVYRVKKKEENKLSETAKGWIILFLKICTFFQIVGFAPIILRALKIPVFTMEFISLNCIAFLAIIIYALHKPNIIYGYLLVSVDWNNKQDKSKDTFNLPTDPNETTNKYTILKPISTVAATRKIKLSESQLVEYTKLMTDLMEKEQLYTNHDFQIFDLATKLNLPIHHCSFVINNQIGKNFRDWINGFRVDHFLKQYPLKRDKITIEAIAFEAGFKNSATFYNAFKKEKGVLPTIYLSGESPNEKSLQE